MNAYIAMIVMSTDADEIDALEEFWMDCFHVVLTGFKVHYHTLCFIFSGHQVQAVPQ